MTFVEITDIDEFQAINTDLVGDYIVVNDIDGSGTSSWNGGEGFVPIGGNEVGDNFSGDVYGSGYSISDIYINRPESTTQGVFGRCSGCFVGDLHLVNVNINGEVSVGGFCAYLLGTIKGCSSSGSVSAFEAGTDEVSGRRVGGFVGWMRGGSAEYCVSSANVSCDGSRLGGFVGEQDGGRVENCYATGDVSFQGGLYAGGFAGLLTDRDFDEARVYKCYTVGEVTYGVDANETYVGGFTGLRSGSAVMSDNFFDTNTTGQDSDGSFGDATGKTTAEMQDISTYNDTATTGLDNVWDIAEDVNWTNEIWSIDDGNDYPKLEATSTQVPDVIGETESDAETQIEGERLFVGTKDQDFEQDTPGGEVIVQSPTANTWVVAGSEVDITISVDGVYVNINGTAVHCPVYVNVNGTAELADVQKN